MFGESKTYGIRPKLTGFAGFFTLTGWLLISSQILPSREACAQFEQVDQLEIPLTAGGGYQIVSNQTEGLIIFRLLSSLPDDLVELIHVDTALQNKWTGYLPVERGWQLAQHSATEKTLSLLFVSSNITNRDFRLLQVHLDDRVYRSQVISNHIPFFPTHFVGTSKGVLIGGYFNRVPVVIFFNIATNRSHILPGLFNEPGELTQVKINDDGTFAVLISAKNYAKEKTLWIKNYDENGGLQKNVMLDPGNNSLIFGRTIKAGGDDIVAGVYGTRSGDYSRGLFIAHVNADGEQQMKYYNFADLENFFNYMKARRQQRIKERIARRKVKGKKIRFSYRFLVHELVPYKDQFVLLGEAFYPKYRTSDRGVGYGIRGPSTQLIFDGYQYTHAVVLGIDGDGKLIWDNSFEIMDVKTYTLQQFVKLDPQDDQIALLYLFDNEIRSKIIRNDEVLEGKTYKELARDPGDETVEFGRVRINNLDYWFKDTFFSYGTRSRFESSNNDRTRSRVFFISKISYR